MKWVLLIAADVAVLWAASAVPDESFMMIMLVWLAGMNMLCVMSGKNSPANDPIEPPVERTW